jgi:LmbE family N-acetylglucosaminyl deacetylase
MKPTSNSPSDLSPLLVFGAHPDDIEFGVGGVVVAEAHKGRPIHLVVCSRGESGTNGTPEQREKEAMRAAALMGGELEIIDLGGDANIENTRAGARTLAGIIRRVRPGIVMAPTTEENQHPDHAAVGRMARDATRLARYGGLKELADQPRHAIAQMLFYPIGADATPRDRQAILYPISDETMTRWTEVMESHASQMQTRNYVDYQIARAGLLGQRAGMNYALELFPNDPVIIGSLDQIDGSSRHF